MCSQYKPQSYNPSVCFITKLKQITACMTSLLRTVVQFLDTQIWHFQLLDTHTQPVSFPAAGDVFDACWRFTAKAQENNMQVSPSSSLTHMSTHADVHAPCTELLTTFSGSSLSSFILQPSVCLSVCSSLSHRSTCPPCDSAGSFNTSTRCLVAASRRGVSDSTGWCMREEHACLTCEGQKNKRRRCTIHLCPCVCVHATVTRVAYFRPHPPLLWLSGASLTPLNWLLGKEAKPMRVVVNEVCWAPRRR